MSSGWPTWGILAVVCFQCCHTLLTLTSVGIGVAGTIVSTKQCRQLKSFLACNNVGELVELASTLRRTDRFVEAASCLLEVVAQIPEPNAQIEFQLAQDLKRSRAFSQASEHYFAAITSGYRPVEVPFAEYLDCYRLQNRLGHAYVDVAKRYLATRQDGYEEAALRYLEKAVEVDRGLGEAYLLTAELVRGHDRRRALQNYQTAVTLEPMNAVFWYQMGTLLFELRRLNDTLIAYEKAVEADPQLNPALVNAAYLKKRVCDWKDYTFTLDRVKALTLRELQRVEEGLPASRDGTRVSIHPHMLLSFELPAELKLRVARDYASDEQKRALQELTAMRSQAAASESTARLASLIPIAPFAHDSNDFGRSFRAFQELLPAAANAFDTRRTRQRRIRVGYFSSDFKLKATAYLVKDLFKYHDRKLFEIFCYATTSQSDELKPGGVYEHFSRYNWRQDIERGCEHFFDISGPEWNLAATVQLIHDTHKIHILVNMDGYSNEGIRKEKVFALQTAPVQVNLLVYCGTLGAESVQYVVTDPATSPLELQHLYTEKFIWMPHSFFVNSHAGMLPPPVGLVPRADSYNAEINELYRHGKNPLETWRQLHASSLDDIQQAEQRMQLRKTFKKMEYTQNTSFVFCNLGQHHKIAPSQFKLWMSILQQTSNSRLFLLRFPPESEERLLHQAENAGIGRHRILFGDFFADAFRAFDRVSLCDVFLDTSVYNAHTTSIDALWAGVPILTWTTGRQMGARVCLSHVHALGLGARDTAALLATSDDDYIAKAVTLFREPALLRRLQQKLLHAAHKATLSPLFDTPRWVRNLEVGWATVWKRFVEDLPVDHVAVADHLTNEHHAMLPNKHDRSAKVSSTQPSTIPRDESSHKETPPLHFEL